jgi:cation transport ATPase
LIAVEQVVGGDAILMRAGEIIPIDGSGVIDHGATGEPIQCRGGPANRR